MELLVVVAVMGILAALLFPALSAAMEKARTTGCLSNQRQMALAMEMYAGDHRNKFPANRYTHSRDRMESPAWVAGYLNNDVNPEDMLNFAHYEDVGYAQFAFYIRGRRIYKCPSDRVLFNVRNLKEDKEKELHRFPKPRSYALNWFIGWLPENMTTQQPNGVVYMSRDAVQAPSAIMSFVDTRPESVCWPFFGVRPDDIFIMFPSPSHGRAGTLSFVDGHAEKRRWRDDRTIKTGLSVSAYHSHSKSSEGNKDLATLRGMASESVGGILVRK